MTHIDVTCGKDTSRDELATSPFLNGIDYVEIVTEPPADNQRVLVVHFVPDESAAGTKLVTMLDDIVNAMATPAVSPIVTVSGGARIDVRVVSVQRAGRTLRVRVDRPGDHSDYILSINRPAATPASAPGLHPAYAEVTFNFKAGCESRFDCRADSSCEAPELPSIAVDYMARDYASFRQALLDLIPTIHPEWIEQNPADVGIALVELMAYVADHLSYYQDAVANEAFLETARQRISVRRHARLIDYAMHDGASARAFVHVRIGDPTDPNPASPAVPVVAHVRDGTQILTRIVRRVPSTGGNEPPGIESVDEEALAAAEMVFEVFGGAPDTRLDSRHNELPLYDWGRADCCLPKGATRADVIGDATKLVDGDLLLLEEVLDAETRVAADADREHRQVVRVRKTERIADPLQPALTLTRITWDAEDALAFPLCVSAGEPPWPHFSVARGNILFCDQGRTIDEEWHPVQPAPGSAAPSTIAPRAGRGYRFALQHAPLSFRVADENDRARSVAAIRPTRAHEAKPQLALEVKTGDELQAWTWQPTLLESSVTDSDYIVETDDDGRAIIRFGNGTSGMALPDGAYVRAKYRVGSGSRGNVAAGALRHLVRRGDDDFGAANILEVRNPLAAWGGVAPEDVTEVKLTAPALLHARTERAVTPEDYAKAAREHDEVSGAMAAFRWTGTWHTVLLTVDPKGRNGLSPELQDRVREHVQRYTQIGYDLEIDPPDYVPVDLELEICVAPGHFRGDVERAVQHVLRSSSGGFFHADRFSFGRPLYLSEVYAAVTNVAGVSSAVVTKFQRLGDAAAGELEAGVIGVRGTEILQLDNDRNFPDRGRLRLHMRSGK
jgi:hypothetical protein